MDVNACVKKKKPSKLIYFYLPFCRPHLQTAFSADCAFNTDWSIVLFYVFSAQSPIDYLGNKLRVLAAATIFKLLSLRPYFLFIRLRALCVSSVCRCVSLFP